MANVDLTLRLTNPAIYNRLQGWQQNGMDINVRLNIQPNFNATQIRQTITQAIGSIPVDINPRLGSITQLRQQIAQAIGNISINVSIGNLSALNNQISSLFAGLGIQASNIPPVGPPAAGPFTPARRLQARLQRNSQNLQLRQEKYQDLFDEKELLSTFINGPQEAARQFERSKGLQSGTVNPGTRRSSFDIGRVFNPAAFREVAISGAVGGVGGLVGGAIGAGFLGSPGVYGGATVGQAVVGSAVEAFKKVEGALEEAAKAGLRFQEAVNNVSISLQATSKVVDLGGKQVDIGTAIEVQNLRSRSLVQKGTNALSPFGVGTEGVSAGIRGIVAGTSRAGISLNESQILKVLKPIAGFTSLTNEDLIKNISRFANDVEDFLAGQTNNELSKSLLGSRTGAQIKSAIASGDAEAFVSAFSEIGPILDGLASNSNNASIALRKVNTDFENLQREFGDKFISALAPGLNELANSLSNPQFQKAVAVLGKQIGELVNYFIQAGAKLAEFLGKNPQIVSGAVAGGGVGALGGAVAGGFAGAPLGPLGIAGGALVGGLLGSGVGTVVGGAANSFGSRTPFQASTGPNLSGFNFEPNLSPLDINSIIEQKLSKNVDKNTILGGFASDVIGLRKQSLSGSISDEIFQKRLGESVIGAKTNQLTTEAKLYTSLIDLGVHFSKVSEVTETFTLRINEASSALNDLTKQRELEQLQGTDKLFGLAAQIKELGGNVSGSFARGFSSFDVGDDLKGKDRRLAILQKQFETESSKLDPFRFDDQTRLQELQGKSGFRDLKAEAAKAKFNTVSDSVEKYTKIRELVQKLPPDTKIDKNQFQGFFNGSDEYIKGLPDQISAGELDKKLKNDLSDLFKDKGIGGQIDQIADKFGGNISFKDINTTLSTFFDSFTTKVADGVKAGLDRVDSN
jgi:hypothetical protein